MRIYLDNNATTAIHPDVLSTLDTMLRNVFGNASSIHKEGQTARQVIEDARESLARLIGASAREIVFTSGGTESNNAAIFGAVSTLGIHHIVTTAIEHPSVLQPVEELRRRGHDVVLVPPSRNGVVDASAVIDAIRNDTRLVTVMLANNETGVVQPVAEIARACRDRGVHIHCDAVQAAGKIEVDVQQLGVDTLSLSAHKIHAPKGIGALYVRRGTKMQAHLFGGAQERRRRAGTENVPLAAAFGVAATLAGEPAFKREVHTLRDRFESSLADLNVTINGAAAERVPNTSNVTFHGADGEGIVIALDLNGIATSTGSACSSGRIEPSHVLIAMGLPEEEARSTVRFSLSRFTTAGEIETTVAVLQDVLPRVRRES
ncbi:MAG TPA: cysteine desulfurase family protein [Thermoanaerobaculia bacterium]|nr:cysteine desulfurase family protein [Thermoanaerobaculia bacterium]